MFFLLVVFNLLFITAIMVYIVTGFVSRDTLPGSYKVNLVILPQIGYKIGYNNTPNSNWHNYELC